MRHPRSLRSQSHVEAATGFTLVEVLVALLIMSILAVMGWRGVDSMVRARDTSQAAAERTLLLSALIGQWEQDLRAVQESASVPPLAFDGQSLRLTRRGDSGVQLVVWSLRDGAWWRWSSPPIARVTELQEAWMHSQQLQAGDPRALHLLDGVQGWQLYFYRGQGWSNAQSSGDVAAAPGASASAPARQQLPTGVRLVIDLPEGKLTRDVLMSTS